MCERSGMGRDGDESAMVHQGGRVETRNTEEVLWPARQPKLAGSPPPVVRLELAIQRCDTYAECPKRVFLVGSVVGSPTSALALVLLEHVLHVVPQLCLRERSCA